MLKVGNSLVALRRVWDIREYLAFFTNIQQNSTNSTYSYGYSIKIDIISPISEKTRICNDNPRNTQQEQYHPDTFSYPTHMSSQEYEEQKDYKSLSAFSGGVLNAKT